MQVWGTNQDEDAELGQRVDSLLELLDRAAIVRPADEGITAQIVTPGGVPGSA